MKAKNSCKPDDGSSVLPSARHDTGKRPAAFAREVAGAWLAGRRAVDIARACRRARRSFVDLSRGFVPAARYLARRRRAGSADLAGGRGKQPESRQRQVFGRQRRFAGGLRRL